MIGQQLTRWAAALPHLEREIEKQYGALFASSRRGSRELNDFDRKKNKGSDKMKDVMAKKIRKVQSSKTSRGFIEDCAVIIDFI